MSEKSNEQWIERGRPLPFKIEEFRGLDVPSIRGGILEKVQALELENERDLEPGEFEDLIAQFLAQRGWTMIEP